MIEDTTTIEAVPYVRIRGFITEAPKLTEDPTPQIKFVIEPAKPVVGFEQLTEITVIVNGGGTFLAFAEHLRKDDWAHAEGELHIDDDGAASIHASVLGVGGKR